MDLLPRHLMKVPNLDADYFPAVERSRKASGRPFTGANTKKVLDAIEDWRRAQIMGLGLRGTQVTSALDYCHRGYTVEAAVRLVLAGGMRRGLFGGLIP